MAKIEVLADAFKNFFGEYEKPHTVIVTLGR